MSKRTGEETRLSVFQKRATILSYLTVPYGAVVFVSSVNYQNPIEGLILY